MRTARPETPTRATSGSSGDEDSGDSGASGSDEVDESSGSSSEDADDSSSSGSSSSSSSDADDSSSSGSSSDDADGYSGGGSEAPDSPDDTVSVTSDDIVGDGADISDPGPSNSGEPVPPRDRRELAHITGVAFQVLESWPAQVIVEVSGELPDPCHELWWEVAVDGNTYDVEVWSVSLPSDSEMACAMVIVPFTENIPLGGGFVDDAYTIIVNGDSQTLSF